MYPTRIPFEESTVYSQINIQHPNLECFPRFKVILNMMNKSSEIFLINCLCSKKSNPYVVDLNPGDVLYVPHNWWHYGKI